MKIPSGVIDQYIYFVAVDATDLKTREIGLTTFTVYRSRNGAAAAAMTTPTVTEVDATNMPGAYKLLLDEDMAIAAGNDDEEMLFHITHAGMAPVSRTINLYRPKITVGETIGVTGGAVDDVALVATTTTNTDMRGTDSANTVAPDNTSIAAILVDTGTDLPATLATIAGYIDTEIATIIANLATVDTVVDGIQTDLSNGTDGLGALKALIDTLDAVTDAVKVDTAAILVDTNELQTDLTNGGRLDLLIDDILADTNELQIDWTDGGRLDLLLDGAASAGDPWTTALPGAYGAGTAGKIIGDNINATISSRMAEASINTTAGAVDNVTLVATTTTNTDMRGTEGANTVAPDNTSIAAILVDTETTLPATLATSQADLDILTGTDGVTLATAQANYAPAKAGDSMDVLSISGDSVAADNLESQYDGTGLTGDSYPSSQAQVGNIATGSSAVSTISTGQLLTTGTEVNDYTDTDTKNGVYHEISDAAGSLDIYYDFDVGSDGIGSEVSMWGRLIGGNDSIGVYAYNWIGATWDQVGVMIGSGSSTDVFASFNLLTRHTGTGANLGKVRIRGYAASGLTVATLYIDQAYVSYANIPVSRQTKGSINDVSPTTTGFDTDLIQSDGLWTDALFILTSGALAGESRVIASYLNTNGALTFDEAFSGALADGDDFIIHHTHIHPMSHITNHIDANSTQLAAIKAKTDSLTFTQAGQVDSNVQRINDVTITGDGGVTPFDVV